jgi:hypothetical protein
VDLPGRGRKPSLPNVTTKFATAPSVTQTLETRMQEPSQFLSAINIYGVTEQMGEKIGMGIGGPNAGTTYTMIMPQRERKLGTCWATSSLIS